jgi:hypothetical protein
MAYPYTIANGDTPDATKLQANFDYVLGLVGGGGLQVGTYAALKVTAAAAPTTPFLAIATDGKMILAYTGDVTAGDTGFITLATFGGIS